MTISLHHVTDAVAYWIVFWTLANALMPPREIFKDWSPKFQARYNTILMIIAYYGALNIRQLTVQLYSAVKQNASIPIPPHQLDNALVDAAASTQQVAEAIDKAQEASPKGNQ